MIDLTREIRFSADRDWSAAAVLREPVGNSWAGWPVAAGLAPVWKLRATVRGPIQPLVGIVCNVKVLDDVLREQAVPLAISLLSEHGARLTAEMFLARCFVQVRSHLPPGVALRRLELAISPYVSYAMTDAHATQVLLTEQFEFSAAHRLHCPQLGDEENRALFGKCNHASGHGHNYVVEVTVAGEARPPEGVVLPRLVLQQVVRQRVIDRFDHKNLNEDAAEFREQNPTVENIARCVWELLVDAVAPARLANVRVYETPKTWADYGGGA